MFVNTYRVQLCKHISEGSVATHLRCGGIFSDSVIANRCLKTPISNNYSSPVIRLLSLNFDILFTVVSERHVTFITFYVYRFYHCIVAVVNLSQTNMNE